VFQLQRHNIRGWKRDCRGRARRVRRCDSLREARQRVVSQSRIEGSIHPAWMDGGTRKGGSKERRKECEAIPTAGEVARLGSGWCCCSHQMSSKRCGALRCVARDEGGNARGFAAACNWQGATTRRGTARIAA
jgi:hypothetical protein